LITGSTKGIGYALAREFLKAGDNVVICSRSAERVETAVQSLKEEFGEHVWGTKCDVTEGKDVRELVAYSQKNLKYIDIWVHSQNYEERSFVGDICVNVVQSILLCFLFNFVTIEIVL